MKRNVILNIAIFIILNAFVTTVLVGGTAVAHECDDPCETNRIALEAAYAQQASIQTRAHNAITDQRTRFRQTFNLALRRIANAQRIANRACGTQYAERAQNHLLKLIQRKDNFVAVSLAAREALIQKIDRAVSRSAARIATLEVERSTLGCDSPSTNNTDG
jgi:hypothetical protein